MRARGTDSSVGRRLHDGQVDVCWGASLLAREAGDLALPGLPAIVMRYSFSSWLLMMID